MYAWDSTVTVPGTVQGRHTKKNTLYIYTFFFVGLTWSLPALKDVRAALFLSGGSSTQSSQTGHVIGPSGHVTEKSLPHVVTPLAPRYLYISTYLIVYNTDYVIS